MTFGKNQRTREIGYISGAIHNNECECKKRTQKRLRVETKNERKKKELRRIKNEIKFERYISGWYKKHCWAPK
jgi:hypothetical protein